MRTKAGLDRAVCLNVFGKHVFEGNFKNRSFYYLRMECLRKISNIDHESNQVSKGYSTDALALRGDEGRGTLRKVPGSREQTLIRKSPNGETHL